MKTKGGGGWRLAMWLGAGCLGLLVLGAVMMWAIQPGGAAVKEPVTLQGHRQDVLSLAFSPDGKTLASGSYDGIKLWDVQTGQERVTLEAGNGRSVAFSPDGKMLASVGGTTTIKLWDVQTGQEQATFEGHPNGMVTCMAFSPDGKTVASGGSDETIKLWDVASGKERATLHGPTSDYTQSVLCVAFSPDGKTLASGSDSGSSAGTTVKLWNVATGKEQANFRMGRVSCMAYSPDGKTLAFSGGSNTIGLWDVTTGKERATLEWTRLSPVNSVAFSPNGKTLALGGFGIVLWDVETGNAKALVSGWVGDTSWDWSRGKEQEPTLKGDTGIVNCVAYSPDGKTLASGGHRKTIKLWDVATGK